MRCIIHHLGPRSLPIRRMSGQSVHHSSQRSAAKIPSRQKSGGSDFWGSWVSESRWWDFICWTCWTPPKENLVFFGVDFFGMSFCFLFVFFCNLALELIWWFFLSEKMGLALLNMDFTEQMGICGVLDLEVEVFLIVFCWMSFFQWVSGLAGFGR